MPRGGGGGGGRGKKFGHKGGNRHFTNAEELKRQQADIEKERERREEEGSDGEDQGTSQPAQKRVVSFGNSGKGNESEESSEESSSEDEGPPKGGAAAVISTSNPNRASKQTKSIKNLTLEDVSKPQLNRKEREAVEAERKRQAYLKLHAEGKTDEARADLERLRIIRMQREEAAKKRETEKAAKEAASAAKGSEFKSTAGPSANPPRRGRKK